MNIFEKIKNIFKRNKRNLLNSANTENLQGYNEQYEKDKNYLESQIKRLERIRDVNKARSIKDMNYEISENDLWVEQLKKDFIRPNTQSDIDERKQIENNFVKLIHQADPEGRLNLRFHGTSIHLAKEIIKSGGIFSLIDRLKGDPSSGNGYIPVTSLENVDHYFPHGMPCHLDYSLGFMDINQYERSYPAGCLFVLIPRNQEESDMIEAGNMHNVTFKENPDALYAIMTTTENLERVKQWMIENGLDSNKVCTMEGLLKKVQRDTLVTKCNVDNYNVGNNGNESDIGEVNNELEQE